MMLSRKKDNFQNARRMKKKIICMCLIILIFNLTSKVVIFKLASLNMNSEYSIMFSLQMDFDRTSIQYKDVKILLNVL